MAKLRFPQLSRNLEGEIVIATNGGEMTGTWRASFRVTWGRAERAVAARRGEVEIVGNREDILCSNSGS